MNKSRIARLVINQVKLDTGLTGQALRKELINHYPFADKSGWAYKAWLNEVAKECGLSRRRKSNNGELF